LGIRTHKNRGRGKEKGGKDSFRVKIVKRKSL